MAYTDDAVKAKLSALNETQDSIVTVAQWIMFHRRHADRTGTLWLNKLKESTASKRLNLIYLANEVAQQSKARKKNDFLDAFSPVIAEATAMAYKDATEEVKGKLRRVVEVWGQRQIFDPSILEAIAARIDEIDKSRASKKKPLLGGSLFSNSSGPSAPAEIQPLVPLQIAVTKAKAATQSAIPKAEEEYAKLTDPTKPTPTPPVHAARLSAVVKNLASAENAVSEGIKARRKLIEKLEDIITLNRTDLASEETQHAGFTSRKSAMEEKKKEVEDGIMRGMPDLNAPASGTGFASSPNGHAPTPADTEPERPYVEELTPPPPELNAALRPTSTDPRLASHQPAPPASAPVAPPPALGADLLSSLSVPSAMGYGKHTAPAKKRKVDDEYADFGAGEDAMADLDDEVAELLRAEGGGR